MAQESDQRDVGSDSHSQSSITHSFVHRELLERFLAYSVVSQFLINTVKIDEGRLSLLDLQDSNDITPQCTIVLVAQGSRRYGATKRQPDSCLISSHLAAMSNRFTSLMTGRIALPYGWLLLGLGTAMRNLFSSLITWLIASASD